MRAIINRLALANRNIRTGGLLVAIATLLFVIFPAITHADVIAQQWGGTSQSGNESSYVYQKLGRGISTSAFHKFSVEVQGTNVATALTNFNIIQCTNALFTTGCVAYVANDSLTSTDVKTIVIGTTAHTVVTADFYFYQYWNPSGHYVGMRNYIDDPIQLDPSMYTEIYYEYKNPSAGQFKVYGNSASTSNAYGDHIDLKSGNSSSPVKSINYQIDGYSTLYVPNSSDTVYGSISYPLETSHLWGTDSQQFTVNWGTASSASSTVLVQFLSVSGQQDLSSYYDQIIANDGFGTSEDVYMTFPYFDDIIGARVYVYNVACTYGTCPAPVYISRLYQWNYFATANSATNTDSVNFGIFRTGTTTCGMSAQNAPWFDFGYGLCVAGSYLFIPSDNSLSFIASKVAIATGTVPFSYIYDSSQYFSLVLGGATSTWSIVMPTSTPVFGGIPLMSSSMITSSPNYNNVRTAFSAVLYLLIPFYIWRRRSAIFGSGEDNHGMSNSYTIDMRK